LGGKIHVTPWQGVFYFTNTVLQKSIDTYCCDETHGKQLKINTIGKKKHTLW
jgi:hypothetical protein